MRVRATAKASTHSNAVGQVELECSPAGLIVGLHGVGAYSEGYAPGALTNGTRFTVPYDRVRQARATSEELLLQIDAPGFPHDRLALSRFAAGPGVPLLELRRRRLILQFAALSSAVLAALTSAMLAPSQPTAQLAWGALGYGLGAASLVLALGYGLDQRLFTRPPGEQEARLAFLRDLEQFYPALVRNDAPLERSKPKGIPNLVGFMPRAATVVGVTLAATVLTALITGQRLIGNETASQKLAAKELELPRSTRAQPATPPSPPLPAAPSAPSPPSTPSASAGVAVGSASPSEVTVERRCLCDRADSVLWRDPIPKLSALLLEQRTVPRRTHLRTHLEIAVVNNSDTPIEEITLHVQFYELRGKERVPTKERPLYFEGPLRPGHAIKWSAEARGTEFSLLVPDLGDLGVDGRGAAPADDFADLLDANHRPVRLHGARLLSFLGDPRGRQGALALKDAMRAAEAPYLRRVLAATSSLRVCDVSAEASQVGVCVYNASDSKASGVGIQLQSLDGSLDVGHPLAHPPPLRQDAKFEIGRDLDPQSGLYVRVPVASDFLAEDGTVEINADRYDLLD